MNGSPRTSQKWTKKQTPNSAFVSVNQVGFLGNFMGPVFFLNHLKPIGMNIVDAWMDGWMGPPS
jgi:hypothetical protein